MIVAACHMPQGTVEHAPSRDCKAAMVSIAAPAVRLNHTARMRSKQTNILSGKVCYRSNSPFTLQAQHPVQYTDRGIPILYVCSILLLPLEGNTIAVVQFFLQLFTVPYLLRSTLFSLLACQYIYQPKSLYFSCSYRNNWIGPTSQRDNTARAGRVVKCGNSLRKSARVGERANWNASSLGWLLVE